MESVLNLVLREDTITSSVYLPRPKNREAKRVVSRAHNRWVPSPFLYFTMLPKYFRYSASISVATRGMTKISRVLKFHRVQALQKYVAITQELWNYGASTVNNLLHLQML